MDKEGWLLIVGIGVAVALVVGAVFLGKTYHDKNMMEHGYVWIPETPRIEGRWELKK